MATIWCLLFVACLITSTSAATYTCDRTAQCGCTPAAPTSILSRIIGGETVQNRTWGWIVSLQLDGNHRCGASLVSAEYVVTAAHCVDDILQNIQRLSILAGTNYLSVTSGASIQRRSVIAIHIHPQYDSNALTNDIAVLRFLPLTIGSAYTISFICLPSMKQDPFIDGSNLIAIGWGVTSTSSQTASNSLQQVTVQAVASDSADCVRVPITNSTVQFCAGLSQGGKDTCQGDSGGPLMAFVNSRWVLAGITSSGYGCALPGYPGLYTRVSRFISYIQSIVGTGETTNTTRITTTIPSTTTRRTDSTTRSTTTLAKLTSSTARSTTRTTTAATTTRPTTSTLKSTARSTTRINSTTSRQTSPTTTVKTTTTVPRTTSRSTTTVPRTTARSTTAVPRTTARATTTVPRTTARSTTTVPRTTARSTTTVPRTTARSTTTVRKN